MPQSSLLTATVAEALPLPFCTYPRTADSAAHGVQPLPRELPVLDLPAVTAHRSTRYTAVPASLLSVRQVLELARVVGNAFAVREPQCRHIRPAARAPVSLHAATHDDPFGRERFGPWTRERLMYWFIRLCVLTDPTSPRSAVAVNRDALAQSVALLDDRGRVMGGALNETMPPADAAPAMRGDDPFLSAAWSYVAPILAMLADQDAEALAALCRTYPRFRDAYERGRVGHHFMVARSDALAKADAFELVASSTTHYRWLGFEYMLVEATNQWTGAACEALNGVRVHFAPFRLRRVVPSGYIRPDETTSPDGYLSDKDSGSMFYVIRLV
jgi:hypothetical protein